MKLNNLIYGIKELSCENFLTFLCVCLVLKKVVLRQSVYSIIGAVKQTCYYLGDYEEEIDAAGNIRKIHYLSGGAVYIQNSNSDSLLYGYSDYQGSLTALTDADGNVLERYAYDPWGQRRNPTNWTQADTRTSWRLNRGYTGHEHLDAFSIINMNGRVYDPLTAMFFSPDPYVQAPDSWLNYNRYGYCYGNPLKYTDPSGEFFFYLIPNIGWDRNGGITIGLTAGLGIPGFGPSISTRYGIKSGDWSVTAGLSAGGFNVYAGYGSGSGVMAGCGYNAFGLPGGLFSNMTGFGVNCSQNGGLSGNVFGMQMTQNGMSFNPSIGASYSICVYSSKSSISNFSNADLGVTDKAHAEIGTNRQKDELIINKRVMWHSLGVDDIDMENEFFPDQMEGYSRSDDGKIHFTDENGKSSIIGGVTVSERGWFPQSKVYMSPFNTEKNFIIALNHEFIHAWQWQKFGHRMKAEEWNSFKEASADSNTNMYHSTCPVPIYNGTHDLYDWPSNLIRVQ